MKTLFKQDNEVTRRASFNHAGESADVNSKALPGIDADEGCDSEPE